MSLTVNPATSAVAAICAQPAAPPAPAEIRSSSAIAGFKPAEPVHKAPVVKTEPLVDPEEVRANLEAAIENLNQQVQRNGRGLNFAVDERLNRPVITVRSTVTGEVVRTIPNEVVLRVAHSIEDIKGLLADHKL
jgi:flagellar protein FlaG